MLAAGRKFDIHIANTSRRFFPQLKPNLQNADIGNRVFHWRPVERFLMPSSTPAALTFLQSRLQLPT